MRPRGPNEDIWVVHGRETMGRNYGEGERSGEGEGPEGRRVSASVWEYVSVVRTGCETSVWVTSSLYDPVVGCEEG